METVQVHVASSLSVVLTWWPRRTTPMAPDFLPSYQSEASQSTKKVTKHSAATAGQLSLGTGGEFLVDQRRIFGTSNRENFIDMFFHSVASNRKLPPTPTLRGSVAVQETEQWVGLCLVPVRFRTYDEQLEALTQVPSPQAQPSLVSLHWFRGDTSPSAELRSLRHLCNDRCRWSKHRLKTWRFSSSHFTVKVCLNIAETPQVVGSSHFGSSHFSQEAHGILLLPLHSNRIDCCLSLSRIERSLWK